MIDINELTLRELSEYYQKKSISIKELVQEYLNRIKEKDQGINGLRSMIEINPDALSIAEKLDNVYSKDKGSLYGVPITLKDNINTGDGMHTSAGSLALSDNIAKTDAEVIKRIRDKGVIILGKNNMTEFANYMTNGMPPGYSSRGGQSISPYKRDADPSGSSTGSAVAVAANLCMLSIGTDTAGSIVSPSINNSIVGYRPSMGLISQKGIVPISFTCDTAGPMARTVEDVCLLFSEITGHRIVMDDNTDIRGMRIGINEDEFKLMDDDEAAMSEDIIKVLSNHGATISKILIDRVKKESIDIILKYEFKYAMNKYLSSLNKSYSIKTLKDIINYNEQNADKALRYGQVGLIDAEENTLGDLSEVEYITSLTIRERKKKLEIESYKSVDTIIEFKPSLNAQYYGMSSITIPFALKKNGMPWGICLRTTLDSNLLKYAKKIETIIGQRTMPKI